MPLAFPPIRQRVTPAARPAAASADAPALEVAPSRRSATARGAKTRNSPTAMAGPTAAKTWSASRSTARSKSCCNEDFPDGRRHDRMPPSAPDPSDGLMWRDWIPFWHAGVSPHGGDVDLLFAGLLFASALVLGLLFFLLALFCVRYRAGNTVDRGDRVTKSWHWEVSWTAASLVCFLGLFVWGAVIFLADLPDAARTNCRCSWSPSNGCGRSSTPAVSPKSTRCIFRSIARSAW